MKKIIIILALAAFTTGTFTSCMDEEVIPSENYSGVEEQGSDDGI